MSLKALKPLEAPVSADVETPTIAETIAQTSVQPTSTDQLLALIATMQQQLVLSQQQAAESNAKLAEAILATTKPRETLKTAKEIAQEANQKMFDDQAKELRRRQKLNIEADQNNCEHIAGCNPLSEERDVRGRSSILWHKTDAQVVVGICTNCQRFFRPDDPVDARGNNYEFYRRKPSINRMSQSGTRQFLDPLQAMKDGTLRDS